MITTILIFLGVLSLLVLVHEWGHFYTAKKMGMKVEEFGLGFPPRIFSWKGKDGMLWSVNLIPLGGFVKIKGESGEHRDEEDSFAKKSAWAKLLVLSAGVIMNIVLAVVLLSIGFGIGIPSLVSDDLPDIANVSERAVVIAQVLPNSPAEGAGLEAGDKILSVNGIEFSGAEEVRNAFAELNSDSMIKVGVEHEDSLDTITVQPEYIDEIKKVGVGVAMMDTGIVSYPWYYAPIKGAETTAFYTVEIVKAFGGMLASVVTGEKVSGEVAGPIGIAVMTGQVAQRGVNHLLQFMALLSINLAILNIFPFPALDGGRMVFVIIEMIRGKENSQKIESAVHGIGFLVLMLLVVVVTFKDILNFL